MIMASFGPVNTRLAIRYLYRICNAFNYRLGEIVVDPLNPRWPIKVSLGSHFRRIARNLRRAFSVRT